jgi:hypothetical protein
VVIPCGIHGDNFCRCRIDVWAIPVVQEAFWFRKETNFVKIFLKFFLFHRPPLWSNGQYSWLQIQRPGFDSLGYQIFLKVVSLERCTIRELLGRKSSGFGLGSREYVRGDPSR